MKEVKIEDRITEVEQLRMLLNMCEIYVNYQQAELINNVVAKHNQMGGDTTVMDACEVLHEHKRRWTDYFNSNEK